MPVVGGLKDKHLNRIDDWLHRRQPVPVDYPDRSGAILDQLLAEQLGVPELRQAVRAL